jgi:flagellar basal-body rod protein FlgC
MSMLRIFDVAGSAVSAQSQRLNVVASNLANADTVAGPDGSPTRRARSPSRPC